MKIAITIAAMMAASGVAVAQDSLAYWAQNDNGLPGGGFGFVNGDFPQPADFGLQAGSAVLALSDNLAADFDPGTGVYNTIQSFAGTTINAQFGEGSGGSIAFQGGSDQVNNGEWFELRFDSSNYENIALSFAAQATGTGFNDVDILAYDGGTLLGDIAVDQSWGSFALQDYSTNLLDGVTDARIRFTFDGATSSSGNNRYDNFLIEGTFIPTPGSAALFGFAGLAAVRRRRA